jgi:CHAT domain-containing protein
MLFFNLFFKFARNHMKIKSWVSFTLILCSLGLLSSCSPSSQTKPNYTSFNSIGAIEKPPPRAMGEYIERLIKHNQLEDGSKPDCGKPANLLDEQSLMMLQDQFGDATPWVFRLQANQQYQQGNTIQAIDLCDFLYRNTNSTNCRARNGAIADKARYLAEIGDYVSAEKELTLSKDCFWDTSYLNRIQLNYHTTRAAAAIAFSKGDVKTAKSKLLEAMAYLRKEGQHSEYSKHHEVMNFRGRWQEADTMIDLARVALWADELLEAEIWARKAVSIPSDATLSHALLVLSEIFFAQGRFDESLELTQTVFSRLQYMCVAKNSLIRARTRDMMAQNLMAKKSWEEAANQYQLIKEELKTSGDIFSRLFEGNRDWALSLLMAGNSEESLKQLEIGIEKVRNRFGESHYLYYEIKCIKAMALAALNMKAEAIKEFGSSFKGLFENWQQKDGQGHVSAKRQLILKLIIESYLNLILEKTETEPGNDTLWEDAFTVALAAQDFGVAKALTKSAFRAVLPDSGLSDSVRKKQDLEIRVQVLFHMLSYYHSNPRKAQNPDVLIQLETEIDQAQSEIADLNRKINNKYPLYSQVINPNKVSASDVRKNLYSDEALMCFFIGDKKSYVWVLTKNESLAFAGINVGEDELAQLIRDLRKGLMPQKTEFGFILPEFDMNLSSEIYDLLLKPVSHSWWKYKKLIVVSQGCLGQIPFSILIHAKEDSSFWGIPVESDSYLKAQWLARTHAISVIPACYSLITLRALQPRSRPDPFSFAGFGDPIFSLKHNHASFDPKGRSTEEAHRKIRPVPATRGLTSASIAQLPRLPETADEILSIATAINANPLNVFLQLQASETTVKKTPLKDRNILIFATHGLMPGDLDGLHQPALALSNPEVTKEKKNDGLLTMSDVMELKLSAGLVILSACNTAAAEGAGAESFSGLGQAFFYAGARSLLVTHWPVETTSAKAITTSLIRRLTKNLDIDRSEALRLTMLEIMKQKNSKGFSYAHPMFWAPFSLVGDSNRNRN